MREIGLALGVVESRVSQLHASAVVHLRAALKDLAARGALERAARERKGRPAQDRVEQNRRDQNRDDPRPKAAFIEDLFRPEALHRVRG